MWGDEGQRRHMLPLRVVHAATADRRGRILDEKDDREPLFYTRQRFGGRLPHLRAMTG